MAYKNERSQIAHLRTRCSRCGFSLSKNEQGYRLVDEARRAPVLGLNYDATLEDVTSYLELYDE